MYAKIASPQWEGVNAFVAWAIEGHEGKARHRRRRKLRPAKLRTATITSSTNILRQRLTRSGNAWATSNFRRQSLTSSSHPAIKPITRKIRGALEKVLKTLVYVEPKSESGEVARNTLIVTDKLLDQHAEAADRAAAHRMAGESA